MEFRMPSKNRMPKKTIPFEDNKGRTIRLDDSLTIGDLIEMGMTNVRLAPHDAPLPDNTWRSKEEDSSVSH